MMSWLYGIQSGMFIKVGVTGSIPRRLKHMNLYNPHPCKVVMRRQLHGEAFWVERRMHKALQPYAIGREWFTADAVLVKAVLTVILRDLAKERAEQILWEIQSGKRAEVRDAKRAALGVIADSPQGRMRRLRRENKIKMLERLANG